MDIPLPSDNTSKERDEHGNQLLPDKPRRNVDLGRSYKNQTERTDLRFRNSSKRDQSSSYKNWDRYGSKHDRNKNNRGRNSLSNYEDGKMHNSSYANRGTNYAVNNEFQGASGNFNSNMSHEYGSEGFKTNISAYHDPINAQQNSSTFNHCLNTMNSVNMPGFGYGGINPVNQCYDPSGISNATGSSSMNNIPPNYNYGTPNLNAYNNTPNYCQLNPIVSPVMSSYNYSDVNSINLPNNMCSTQPPESYLNYNAASHAVHSLDNISTEGTTATPASLALPMPPLPPVLPKTFNKTANESVSEVPLPKLPPITAIMPDTAPPLSSALTDISKIESSLDCKSLSQEVPCANQDIKLSNLQDPDFEVSKSNISDVIQNNPALGICEVKVELQNKEVGNMNNKLCEKPDHKLGIIDSNCELGSTIEENKIEKADIENIESEKVTAKEACDVKKVTLAFSSNIKTVNIEKSFLDSCESNSPRKKSCNFPCLGKEEAKKRLRAFSAAKLLVKEKTTKPSRINPLQDDQDDNENNSQTNHSNEDKKETSHKKKKTTEMSSIAQIKEKEERVKRILNQNNEIIKSYNTDLASSFHMYNLPGINYFDISNLEKFEEKNTAVQKFLELRREEEAKNDSREKRRSRSVSNDHDRRRDKKYSKSDSRESRREETNKVKKSKGSQRKEVELPKSWIDVKELMLKMEDLCNFLQKNKLDHSRSRSNSPSFEAESGTHKRRDKRKFQCDPFPFFPKNIKDLHALKREERAPLSKDYNSFRQDNLKKSYRGCNVQYTSAKPTICYNIDSERYDYQYLSQKALKYKNSSDVMHTIDGFHNKSFKRQDLGIGVDSTKTRMWYPVDWMKATRERSDEKEMKSLAREQTVFAEDSESFGHSSKKTSSNLKIDDQNIIAAESCSVAKLHNEKVKYRRNVIEVKKHDHHYDKKIESDLDMHARFFTEENDEDEEEIVDKGDNSGVHRKQQLNESKDSYADDVDAAESVDEKFCAEKISKSLILDEEYEAFLCTFDSKTLPEIKHKATCLIESSFKEELNLKPLSKELVKELKTKAHSDVPAHKVYEEVKAILKVSDSNEEGYEKLKKLKKKLKQRMDKEKRHKKKAKKELKGIKKGKKTKKALLEEVEPFKKKEDGFDDISPEQDMLDYEVIEYENYYDESEQQNIGPEVERSENGKGKNSELSGSDHDSQFSPDSNFEGRNAKILHQEDEVSNADQEKDSYSPSNISQYSEEGIDVDSNNMAMELSSPSAPSSSPQLDSTGSPSSHPYSPSNMFDDEEYAPSPYSPSSPQSSGSCTPPLNDKFSQNKQETILNSIPIPPSNFNILPDNLAQQEGSNDLSDKNIASGELKESSISGIAVKGFQPVTFKLNLTRQTNAKLLQKPSLAGFDLDEEEEIENTKSPLPIAEIKDLPLLAFETKEGELLLPQDEAKSEKHLVESIKYIEKDNLNNDNVKTRKRESEKKKKKSPSPRKSSRHHSRSRSRSPKEYRRKSYEKAISKSPCRKEKSYRDSSPLSSNSYRRNERSMTPENYKHSCNKSPSASEKQRHVRSPSMEKIRDVYEKDVCYNKKSKSRTPSPVTKWKKVRSPPPKMFRQKPSYDREEEPYSEHPYKKEMPTEDYSATSSHNRSRSRERSPKGESVSKHKEDENFYPSYDGVIRPISSISNFDFTNGNNEYSDHSLDESLKQEVSPEYEEYNHHGSEYGNCNYWGYNTNQLPRQVAGSSQVVRIGNVLQVLPQDSSLEDVLPTPVTPPGAIQSTSKDSQEIGQSSAIMPRKMVQTGNIIEVVPAGISEQEILVSNSGDKETAVFNSGLVPHIPLPDKPSPLRFMLEKSSATKISPEKPSPDRNMYENASSLKIIPEILSPLINLHDNMLHRMETLPENLSPLKSPDILSPVQSPVMPVGTSASLPLPASNPLAISSSFVTSPMSRKDHNIDGAASTYVVTLPNQSTSSAIVNPPCYGETFATQENTTISIQDPMSSSTMELRTAHADSPLITSLELQKQAILSAAVSAARGDTAGDHALAQLLSVLHQQGMAPMPVDNLSAQHPIDQPMMNVDLAAFKQQKRERKERKQKEKEQRQARREKRRLDRENLEFKSKCILSDDEDDIVMKEAITEVPDLGSPVPEYEIYNDDEDEDEQELEKKDKPALVILPPPEKGILVSPSYRILNIKKGKSVSFADGVIPGDGTDVSGGEEIHSPPPPNAEPEKKKGKKLTKKKRVKVKRIKQFKFGNSRMDSPPPPPAFPPNGNVIKLYQGCSFASCTAPGTYVVYTQRPVEANVDGGANITGQVTIPPGMLLHAAALSRVFPPVEGIMPVFTSFPQVMESPIVPI